MEIIRFAAYLYKVYLRPIEVFYKKLNFFCDFEEHSDVVTGLLVRLRYAAGVENPQQVQECRPV